MTAASGSSLPPALLDIQHLHKRYPGSDLVLTDICLRLGAGEVLGLIGSSGAGKSTLIRCVNRLVEPSAGSLVFAGQDVCALPQRALRQVRRQIGMVFQSFALVERLTVMENVLSGRLGYLGFWRSWFRRFAAHDLDEAYRLLARLGLGDMENKRADALSGGQRQRVGLARALIQRPRLLMVDEPTASLDPRTSREIMRLLLELCREQGVAAIVSTHDVLLATEFLPRIVGLRDGAVVYDGPASAVDSRALDRVYGDDDWTAMARHVRPRDPGADGRRPATALDAALR
jgi:phosphonate transport system ATP-binding protein